MVMRYRYLRATVTKQDVCQGKRRQTDMRVRQCIVSFWWPEHLRESPRFQNEWRVYEYH